MSAAAAFPIVLHIWPSYASALSLDPQCTAALLYSQIAIPGQFSVEYSSNPDLSPSGQLPYLTHGYQTVSSLQAIVKHIENLAPSHPVEDSLGAAQTAARISHVQSEYGDLVSHMQYALNANWWKLTRPALVSMLPVPQRYYVPGRMRESYIPRLEAAELWGVPGLDDEEKEDRIPVFPRGRRKKKQTKQQKAKNIYEREKVVAKARAFFSIYSKLLGGDTFFSRTDRPTSLDVVFAAHTHVLATLPFADPLLSDFLKDSFPTLIAHADAVRSFAFPDPQSFPPSYKPSASQLKSLIPWNALSLRSRQKSPADAQERAYALGRWLWGGLALAGLALYWRLYGLGPGVVIQFVKEPEEEYEEEGEGEEELAEDETIEEEVGEGVEEGVDEEVEEETVDEDGDAV